MFATLGDIKLEVTKYCSSLEHTEGAEYAEISLMTEKPVLQRIGEKLDSIKLTVLLNTKFGKPEDDLQTLRELMKSGKPFSFVYGNGSYKTDYVIESMRTTVESARVDGSLISATVSLDLKEAAPIRTIEKRTGGEATEENIRATNELPPDPPPGQSRE